MKCTLRTGRPRQDGGVSGRWRKPGSDVRPKVSRDREWFEETIR